MRRIRLLVLAVISFFAVAVGWIWERAIAYSVSWYGNILKSDKRVYV